MTDPAREDRLRDRLAALTPAQRAALEERLGAAQLAPAAAPAAMPASDRYLPFPMTGIQQAYWAGRTSDFEFGKVATHSYVEIDGVDLDLERLNMAWNRLVARHDMLRAIFLPDGTQRVLDTVPAYRIAVEDFRDLPPGVADERLATVRDAMSHQVLPADRWPLFDIRASLLDGRRVRLHLSFDALIADLSSRRVLMREWGLLYRDAAAELTPLTTTFREIVLTDQVDTASPAYARARDYWLARIDTLPPPPDLPIHEGYDRQQPPFFKRRSQHFDAIRKAALDRTARAFGVSLNMLLLTAYTDVLRLWSTPSFTLNLTLFNRPPGNAAAASVVGDFTALTLLEVDAPAEESFAARARRLQDQLWRDLDHRQFSGVEMLREIAHRRGFGGAIMPVVFTSALSGAGNGLGWDLGWMGDETYSVSQTPQVWLDLMAIAMGDGLVIHWNAVEALFPAGLMDDMFGAFCGLLDHLARGTLDGASRWRTIAETLLPDDARRNQDAANATSGPLPTRLLHDLWKDHVATGPDRPALISSALTLSYAELATLATNLGHRLRALGVRPNMLVGVVMNKGWEQVAAVLAILESGGAYVPIDPDSPAARLHYLLADAQVSIVLTQPGLIDSLAWPEGIRLIALSADDLLEAPGHPLQPAQSPSDLAYVIYTSGSTGQPKGVAIDHRGAVNTIEDINARFAIGPSDHVLALSALTFDLSVHDIFGVLAAGGTIILPDPDGARDPAHWADLIARHGVTLWNSVPALMELLVDYAHPRGATFDPLRLVLLSGDRIPLSLPPAIRAIAPAARTISLGGATEASIWSIWHDTAEVMPGLATIPYGKPMLNQFFRVLSPDMVSCPIWVPGELYIGGIGLAQGYWRDSARTEASFIVHGETGVRLYRTGDRGRYLPDGSIEFLGRDDSQIKLRGFRVELGEIESVLAGHPAVREAVVVASGTDSSERMLAAYIVAQATEMPGTAEISTWLRDRLPGYMVPAQIILLPNLPLTPNGKVDRHRLSLTDKPAVVPMSSGAATGPHADQLARLVRQSCRIDIPASDSNFLDLGLTSIDMIRIVNAIDAELGFRPGIEKLYAAPTIDWIAGQYVEWLGGNEPDRTAPGRTLTRPGTRAIDSVAPSFVLSANAMPTALADLLRQRRTIRQFALRPIDVDHLGALLAAAMPQDGRYPYGSASSLYPVQTWLHAKAGRITGLAPGAHRYDPEAHVLRPLDSQGRLSRSAFSPHNAPVIDEAAFILFLVADMAAIEPTYGDRAEHLATLEAGLMTQLFELAAPACGLGLCQIGSADNEAVRALFGLSDRHRLLHIIAGGYPDDSPQATMPPDTTEEARLARLFQRIERLAPDEVRALLDACPGVIG